MELRDWVCYKCPDLHPVPLKGKFHIFSTHKAAQSLNLQNHRQYDLQKFPVFSVKINWNASDPRFFQLMVYKFGR